MAANFPSIGVSGSLGPVSGGVSIGAGGISAGLSIGGIGPAPATPFQATLAECSFRGVPFIVEEFGGGVGRRGELHEYPLRDIPYAEDLGRRARRWRWRAYVLGDDALAQWSALCTALEQSGPGTLALPDGTSVQAQADPKEEQRYTVTLDKGRKVSFELAFVEAGQILYPGSTPDTQAASKAAAANLSTAKDNDFSADAYSSDDPSNRASSVLAIQAAGAQLDKIDPTIGAPASDQPTFGAQDAY